MIEPQSKIGADRSKVFLATYSVRVTGAPFPLTRDFLDIGRVPYYGDTTRFRKLVPSLRYRTVYDWLDTL